MTEKTKILFCGDVEGKFDALFKRVATINKQAGPFDLLLCIGNFFGINNKEFLPYRLGEKKVPISTYILGPNTEDHIGEYPKNEASELCENVHYLGKRGLYTDSKGIKIAYLSGIGDPMKSEPWTYNEKDVEELCDLCIKGNPSFRGVDILLVSQWPSGVTQEKDNLDLKFTSDYPAYICTKLKPRYIVSALEGIFYERAPFRCPNLGDHDTTMETTTRFIGLARVGNPNKHKWIYALSLSPLDKMKISELLQKTTDETLCPFNFYDLEPKVFRDLKRKSSGPNQYFYDMNATDEDSNRKNTKHKRQKIEFDQSKCWFCLASPSVEKHLIVAVGDYCYLSLAKGGLVDEHLLICPLEHFQSTLSCSEEIKKEMKQFKEALQKFYDRRDEVPVFFERNYKTSHMQVHVIPIPKKATRELKEIFIEESESQDFKLETLESHNRLDMVIPPKTPYFMVELPDDIILYTKIHNSMNFPLSFGREVLASGPILNLPNRVEYKECMLGQEKETELVQRIRTDFEPYDFTM